MSDRTFIAGEELKVGDIVFIHTDGKLYKAKKPESSLLREALKDQEFFIPL